MQGARLDRLRNFDEEHGLVERDAKLAGRVHEQALFIGLQEVHRGGRRDGAVLVLVRLDRGE